MRRTARGVIPSGPALHRGQCRSLLAVSCFILQAMKTNCCSLLDSPARIFLAGQRHFLRSVAFQWVSPDTGTVHLEFHPQKQLAREDPMAADPATIGRKHSSYARCCSEE